MTVKSPGTYVFSSNLIVLTLPIQSSADNGEMILAGHHNSDLQPHNTTAVTASMMRTITTAHCHCPVDDAAADTMEPLCCVVLWPDCSLEFPATPPPTALPLLAVICTDILKV